MNRTTREKRGGGSPKGGSGKPVPKIPVPASDEKIVLTGLVHMENGESLERQLAFCTGNQNSKAFFLGPEDIVGPDSEGNIVARCPLCRTGAGRWERHWVEDFRTAVFEGIVQTQGAGYILNPVSLLKNLRDGRPAGPAGFGGFDDLLALQEVLREKAKPAAARKAATS